MTNQKTEPTKQPLPSRYGHGLGPKQMAWCDKHLGNFATYRKGVEQVVAETEASRKAHLIEEMTQ